MSPLRQAVADYLTVRRALGFKLERHGRLLGQFVSYLEDVGADTITTEHALAWATLPSQATPVWWAERFSVVRGFARYLQTIDTAAELPPTDLLPTPGSRRATPYLYSDQQIAALLAAAGTLRAPLRAATMQTLIGLLAVTGMRIGEAIRLDRGDLDLKHQRLVVHDSKFGKSVSWRCTRPRPSRCVPTCAAAISCWRVPTRPRCLCRWPARGCFIATSRTPFAGSSSAPA